MLIERPSDTRTDAPDEAPADQTATDEGVRTDAEPDAPAEAAEPDVSTEDQGAEAADEPEAPQSQALDPVEALEEELPEPAEEKELPSEEATPALEREETPAEVEAVSVQEPEERVTAEAEVPTQADAAETAAEPAEPAEAPAAELAEASTPESAAEDAEAPTAEEPPPAADPFGGPGDWYVIHTYAGYENKVKTNLESRIHTMQMGEKIFDVHIPMEDVMEIKSGKKQVVQKKVFPGYLLVKMVYDDDSWYVVRNTPGVTGFVSSGTGQRPTPLSRREVEKILTVKEEEAKKPAFRLEFEEGDVVRIISGPFADFNGTISDINVDQSKLRVMVNIFDRETPVELGFDQVAKV
jgi:transcription termination/antitermination protein NusG